MRFCFFLKLIKEQEQNEESFQKKTKHEQTIEMKQLKQKTTFKYNRN